MMNTKNGLTVGQNQDALQMAINSYVDDVDVVGVWWVDTKGNATYSEMDTVTACVLFYDAAKVEKMSNGGYHVRIMPGVFRRAVYSREYRSYLDDKKKISIDEFKTRQKAWNNERNKYAYNTGNFGEWFAAIDIYGLSEHSHHNTEKGYDIQDKENRLIEVKTLVGCAAQIPLDTDFLHSIDIW